MSVMSWLKMPFEYRGESDFFQQLDHWTADLFYDRLPELGYEVREEQIYTTFRIIKALKEKAVLLAEAGSGTGKTFAYLLPMLCYARLKGSPVVIACSSAVLQEQLASHDGDVATLSRQLNLEIDARVAKRQEHYACELKLERLDWSSRPAEKQRLLAWSGRSARADRSEIPEVSDAAWSEVAWDRSLDCDHCQQRSGCRLIRARKAFREARDFVICEHEVFFRDLWLRDELQFKGRLTHLPEYSAVVFDEAHLIELPLAKSLGRQLGATNLQRIVDGITDINEQRLIVAKRAEQTLQGAKAFFAKLQAAVLHDERADRMHVQLGRDLLHAADRLERHIEVLQDELVIEESMHEDTSWEWALAYYQEQLDAFKEGLGLLLTGESSCVTWWEPADAAAWVLPREFSDALRHELFVRRIPVVFTSATLAVGNDFTYIEQVIGAEQAQHAQVGAPFDLSQQVAAYVDETVDGQIERAVPRVMQLLQLAGGRTLILCNTTPDVQQLRQAIGGLDLPYRLLWEGDADRPKLLEEFRSDISSVLIGSEFWEGIDIPGEALSQVLVLTLPFPSHDPLVEARRREAQEMDLDPYATIDLPAMLIKLRQGFGRLIRTAGDRGLISILDSRPNTTTHELVLQSLPRQIPVKSNLHEFAQVARRVLAPAKQ